MGWSILTVKPHLAWAKRFMSNKVSSYKPELNTVIRRTAAGRKQLLDGIWISCWKCSTGMTLFSTTSSNGSKMVPNYEMPVSSHNYLFDMRYLKCVIDLFMPTVCTWYSLSRTSRLLQSKNTNVSCSWYKYGSLFCNHRCLFSVGKFSMIILKYAPAVL